MATLSQKQYDELKRRGLDDDTIISLAKSRGDTLPSKDKSMLRDFSTGFVKGVVGDVVRPTTQLLQGLGQRAIAAATPMSLEQVRGSTGLKGLDDSTPEGKFEVQSLKTSGGAETTGRVVANIASFFVPTSKATQATGRALSKTGQVVDRLGIGLSSKEAPLMQAYKAKNGVAQRIMAALGGDDLGKPITNADTAIRNGLFGTESMIGVQAKRAAGNIWDNMIDPVLKNTKEVVDMPSFINELRERVGLIANESRRKALMEGLDAFSDDFSKLGRIDYKKLQRLKEGWAEFLPGKAFKGKNIEGVYKQIQNMAASLARNKIYKIFPDDIGKVAYLDYGNMKNLQKMGQDAMTGSKLKGGAGSYVNAMYHKVITPIATIGGLGLYKAGKGLEFISRPGVKILGELFK